MASLVVNTPVVAPAPTPWLTGAATATTATSPRISFSCDDIDPVVFPSPGITVEEDGEDFEFSFDDLVHSSTSMLPADELFCHGKLKPQSLDLPPPPQTKLSVELQATTEEEEDGDDDVAVSLPSVVERVVAAAAVSPRELKCSSRWREILNLRRRIIKSVVTVEATEKKSGPSDNKPSALKQLKILNRISRQANNHSKKNENNDSSISTVPLLRDSDSSSSVPDPDDLVLPRLSLNDENSNNTTAANIAATTANVTNSTSNAVRNLRRVRISKQKMVIAAAAGESPRMNASGKVVFKGLERSSSSPAGSFQYRAGTGLRVHRRRSMERSNSAHVVRVTPVLNVPVCSLRGGSGSVFGLGHLFGNSPQKKDGEGSRNFSTVTGAAKSKTGDIAADSKSSNTSKAGKTRQKRESNSQKK